MSTDSKPVTQEQAIFLVNAQEEDLNKWILLTRILPNITPPIEPNDKFYDFLSKCGIHHERHQHTLLLQFFQLTTTPDIDIVRCARFARRLPTYETEILSKLISKVTPVPTWEELPTFFLYARPNKEKQIVEALIPIFDKTGVLTVETVELIMKFVGDKTVYVEIEKMLMDKATGPKITTEEKQEKKIKTKFQYVIELEGRSTEAFEVDVEYFAGKEMAEYQLKSGEYLVIFKDGSHQTKQAWEDERIKKYGVNLQQFTPQMTQTTQISPVSSMLQMGQHMAQIGVHMAQMGQMGQMSQMSELGQQMAQIGQQMRRQAPQVRIGSVTSISTGDYGRATVDARTSPNVHIGSARAYASGTGATAMAIGVNGTAIATGKGSKAIVADVITGGIFM